MPPVLFYFPWFGGAVWPVTTYGLMRALAIVVGVFAARRAFAAREIDPDHVYWAAIWVTPVAVLGATFFAAGRAARAALTGGEPLVATALAELTTGGTLLLALPLTILAFAAYVRLHRLPIADGLDALGLCAALALPVQRLGCYWGGCCYGRPTGLPWAVVYTATSGAYPDRAPLGVPIHPTQLYDAASVAALAAILLWLYSRPTATSGAVPGSAPAPITVPRGTVFAAFLAGYGSLRFVIEFVRDDPRTPAWEGGPLLTQFGTGALAIAGVVALGWIYSTRSRIRPTVEAS